ncbi:class F sortase [Streptomyces griseomycini]|uniref:LPXTG-site transpeptidase (Sortase) family protein n=1 Tax=Streptomyces griseomycini TaxID=66895 RepID=A0A7W7M098_9ACTN|nr:class F sortase [Streptomyces griseomycini]MBB4899755.1 LPXTG-site transpeptidase (sortase) family protein [Streptomyces griseomycini]GGP97194.1 class F sortase [Streptomyces griseomycini]GGR06950.1 class F sortase [Streptomyces griseomycini]
MTAVFWSGTVLVLAMTLLGGGGDPPDDTRVPHAPPAISTAAADPGASEPEASEPSGNGPSGKYMARSKPTRLLIPEIDVDAPFVDLAIGKNGQLDAPPPHNTNLVGWFAKGATPGEKGTSIIAGHVDTATSPAVFARLSELEEGDRFRVVRADGSKATFKVHDTESFDKDDFPDERVYADASRAEVRLITCAGDYDRAAKDYTENLVVFAHLV